MATSPASDFRTTPGMPVDGILLAEELLDLAERAQAYTNAAGVAIALLRGKDLLVRTSTGSAPEVGSVIPADDAFIAECLRRRKPLCCRDTESDGRIGAGFRAMKIRSLIAIPICGQPAARGVMVVIAPLPNAFQPTHTAILMTLSDIIGSKLAARETGETSIDLLDEPSPALAAITEAPKLLEMPAVAAISIQVAPPPVQAAPAPVELKVEAPAAKPPATEIEKPSAPVEAASTSASATAPAVSIPPALMQIGPLPLVAEKTEIEPGLMHQSENPSHFRHQRSFSASTIRPELPKIVSKPAAPVAVATSTPRPELPKIAPVAFTALPTVAPAPAEFVSKAAIPALISWDEPRKDSNHRRFLLPGAAVVAVFVVAVTLWMHRSTSAETAPPTIPVPAAVALSLPPAAPIAAQPVATSAPAAAKNEASVKNEAVAKPEEHAQSKSAKTTETPAPQQSKPQRPLMEIAAAQPKPKLEPEADMSAPKLVLAGNDAALTGLSKMHVAVPAPPKSELVVATLVSRVAPVYPNAARQMGIAGMVVMDVTIGPDGSVTAVRATSGAMQLRGAAVDAVRRWHYKPATLNGKPVESSAQVQINFTR